MSTNLSLRTSDQTSGAPLISTCTTSRHQILVSSSMAASLTFLSPKSSARNGELDHVGLNQLTAGIDLDRSSRFVGASSFEHGACNRKRQQLNSTSLLLKMFDQKLSGFLSSRILSTSWALIAWWDAGIGSGGDPLEEEVSGCSRTMASVMTRVHRRWNQTCYPRTVYVLEEVRKKKDMKKDGWEELGARSVDGGEEKGSR